MALIQGHHEILGRWGRNGRCGDGNSYHRSIMASHSYVISNGTIIDGSGFPAIRGSIGIGGDQIKTIGAKNLTGADRIIDASEYIVAPGFIDITNHSDTYWTLF